VLEDGKGEGRIQGLREGRGGGGEGVLEGGEGKLVGRGEQEGERWR
jgi:hypothetical protein